MTVEDESIRQQPRWLSGAAMLLRAMGRLEEALEAAESAARADRWNIDSNLSLAARIGLLQGDVVAAHRNRLALGTAAQRGPTTDALLAELDAGIAALDGQRDAAHHGFAAAADGYRRAGVEPELAFLAQIALATLGADDPVAGRLAEDGIAVMERLGGDAMAAELSRMLGGTRRGAERS